jgi:hypothetical protein
MAPGAAHRVTARPHLACCQGNVNTLKRPAKLSISVVNDILLAITLVRPRGLRYGQSVCLLNAQRGRTATSSGPV